MTRAALHELVDKVKESEVEMVFFLLSRVVGEPSVEEVEPFPDELNAIADYEREKASGEKFFSHEEAWR
ncbi:MAG: hypothetical protein GX256_00570 [Fretibacterium sp.]|nr:hypothetical protein [Fretibacterium sp.]